MKFGVTMPRAMAQPSFLGATKHLYNWLCPLVGRLVCWSVGNAFVRRSTPSHLLAYLALFFLFEPLLSILEQQKELIAEMVDSILKDDLQTIYR